MASVRIGRTDAFSSVEGSREELVRRGLTLKDLGVDAAKHGFVLLPRRWVVERSFARAAHWCTILASTKLSSQEGLRRAR
jgi:transposase